MRVYHFNSELSGGAGVAAQRLHAALRRLNIESTLRYSTGIPATDFCERAFDNSSFVLRNMDALARSWRNRRNVPQGFLTSPQWFRRTRLTSLSRSPHLVNLHWVSRWLDLPSFFASVPEQLPVVWSLHDMNPLTGGCHHAGGCDRFTLHCAECPQLRRPGSRDDAYRFFEIKDRCYRGKNLHIVGNSEWTTAQARRSGLMRHARSFHTILPGLDVEMFKPVDKWCARRALGIEAGRFVVGFACADCADPNKGGAILAEALGALSANAGVTLLAFGGGRLPDAGGRYQRMALGRIDSPTLQTLFYSACDIFAAPSRIESFGLTALEAMACGTPVVAFRTGGLGEVVEAGRTGLLEDSVGDSAGFSRHLIWMLEHPHERQQMGYAARQRVEDRFSSALMAERYSALYRSLLPTGA